MELRLQQHGLVDSTSERAFEALDRGTAQHGDVHLARGQSAGRGRRGAAWFSPPGEGLYLSVILLPPPPPLPPAALTAATALAVRAAVGDLGAPVPTVKWPNDLVIEGAKLAGILVETRGLDPARPHYVVGIGVNVRQRAFPAEVTAERPATSLALAGVETEPEEVADRILAALPEALGLARTDRGTLAAAFLAATGLAGQRVRLETPRASHEGTLAALDLDRGIELRTADPSPLRVPVESVTVLGPA